MEQQTTFDVAWIFSRFREFEHALNGGKQTPIHARRKEAFEQFVARGFPRADWEEWRSNATADLQSSELSIAPPASGDAAPSIAEVVSDAIVIVIENGRVSLPSSDFPKGLSIRGLRSLLHGGSAGDLLATVIEKSLTRIAGTVNDPFVALNTAFLEDGVAIVVTKGAEISQPIHLVWRTTGGDSAVMCFPRVVVLAGENSSVRIIESFVSSGRSTLTCPVAELALSPSARVDLTRVITESATARHFGRVQATIAAQAKLSTHVLTIQGRLVRTEVFATLTGEGADCALEGLTLLDGERHGENHTIVEHTVKNCPSHQLYRGIYAGRSHGVFDGTIIVREGADKTAAFQANRSLLLSNDATVDAKPRLKIWADDVKCTHGATIGQLDRQQLFYLRSRGIPEVTARALLVHAFAGDVVGNLPYEGLRVWCRERIGDVVKEALGTAVGD